MNIAIISNYNAFRFEVWLVAKNREIQQQYRGFFRAALSVKYRFFEPAEGFDSIIAYDIAEDFDIIDPVVFTSMIEKGTNAFGSDIETALSDTSSFE